MFILRIEHPVRDFDGWKEAFDRDPLGREKMQVKQYRVIRPVDNADYVTVDLEFETTAQAETMLQALRGLWNRIPADFVMSPRTRIFEIIESDK